MDLSVPLYMNSIFLPTVRLFKSFFNLNFVRIFHILMHAVCPIRLIVLDIIS